MRRVHADDIFGQLEHSRGQVVDCYAAAQVGHGFAIAVAVGDYCEGVGAVVLLDLA